MPLDCLVTHHSRFIVQPRVDEATDEATAAAAGAASAHDGAARRGEPFSELYSHPEWENLSMFDRDDLLEDGIFVLLTYRVSYLIWMASDGLRWPRMTLGWPSDDLGWPLRPLNDLG